MTLPIEAAALVLVAALLHATWNAMVKVGHDRLVVLTIANATGVAISLALSPFVSLPLPAVGRFCWALSFCIRAITSFLSAPIASAI